MGFFSVGILNSFVIEVTMQLDFKHIVSVSKEQLHG
jgi:hypothetical protein